MYSEILVRYWHFVSIFTICGCLVVEMVLLKSKLTRTQIKVLSRVDAIYGIASISLLASGFTLWFGVGKSTEFYSNNWVFWLKISLALLLGVLSIYPTVFFIKNRSKKTDDGEESLNVPPIIRQLVLTEVIVLVIIPFCAVLMAKGVGLIY